MPAEYARNSDANPLDALLGRYAAGALDPALYALVQAHLELKPDNRRFVQALEGLEGERLLEMPLTDVETRDACLARIFGEELAQKTRAPSSASSQLPASIRRYVGRDLDAIAWRSLLPGVRECKVNAADGIEASLFWIGAGRAIPSHTHEGSETTLVLQGAFSDLNGHYGRGDIVIADAEIDHRPTVDKGGDCLCFAVTEGHLHLTGPVGRIIDRFFGPR